MARTRCSNPACGTVSPSDEARFCVRCGAALPRAPSAPPRPIGPVLREVAWRAAPLPVVRPPAAHRAGPPAPRPRRGRGVPVEFASVAVVLAAVIALLSMIGRESERTAFRTLRTIPARAAMPGR